VPRNARFGEKLALGPSLATQECADAADFFSVEALTVGGLVRYFVFFVIPLPVGQSGKGAIRRHERLGGVGRGTRLEGTGLHCPDLPHAMPS
jgi:hypothetical protein